jgi:hypothetical protein
MPQYIDVTWTGANGTVWDLTAWDSPVQVTTMDLPSTPAFSQQFASSPARDGRRYEGTTWQQADCVLTLIVGDVVPPAGQPHRRRGTEWRKLDKQFRLSMSPSEPGKLTITDRTSATSRHLHLRLDKPLAIPGNEDPAIGGVATYSAIMTADDSPWWEGEVVPATFAAGSQQGPFFGGPNNTTLLYISQTDQLANATITNPGDREAWPVWWARGPFLTAEVGIGDEKVILPFSRGPNQTVHVDSYNQTITDENGDSLWDLMGFTDPVFAAIHPGETVPLHTTLTGSDNRSAIGVSLTPLYEGPW